MGIFSFEIKTVNKNFLHIFLFFKNNRRTNVILINIFENAQKTVINHQKRPKWLLTANKFFFCVFKNTYRKNICGSFVFKAESKPKHEEKHFLGFFSKTKNVLFQGSKMVLFKSQISNLYFCVCSLM